MNIRNRKKIRNPQSAIRNRKGILLLVVLSMLTLFLLIGTAFIVSANHYRRAQKALARATEATNSSTKTGDLLDEVLNQLVRDTNNQYSSLRFHSLLRDLYGTDGLEIGPGTAAGTIRFVDIDEVDFNSVFPFTDDRGIDITVPMLNNFMTNTGDQLFWVAAEVILPDTTTAPPPSIPPVSPIDNYYNGNLLTFIDGELEGATTRILSYDYQLILAPTATANGQAVAIFTLLPLAAAGQISSANLTSLVNPQIGPADRALLNGRPFNGTGVGYNSAATGARLSAGETLLHNGMPNYLSIALMPNASFFDARNVDPRAYFPNLTITGTTQADIWNTDLNNSQRSAIQQLGFAGLGGSDESYDAVDFQNMALALLPMQPQDTVLPTLDPNPSISPFHRNNLPPDLGNMVLPSFHRSALLNYWEAQLIAAGSKLNLEPNLLRKVMLRPSWFDHPDFTGSNPDLATSVAGFSTALQKNDTANIEVHSHDLLLRMIYGPWDVDNDNDGIRDSVWVDFGAPVMTRADGTRVKPLAALLVVDLDGRLNVNAHGSIEHANTIGPAPPQKLAGGILSDRLPAGAGYGTADISLSSIFPQTTDLTQLIRGTVELPGRYGWDIPGQQQASISRRAPGLRQKKDLATQLDRQGLPRHMADPQFGTALTAIERRSAYGSPPDLHGRYALGLNDFGQPVHEAIDFRTMEIDTTVDRVLGDDIKLDEDTPYEMDLSLFGPRGENPSSADTPYSLGELERVLRSYDVDAPALPPRLWELAKGTATTPAIDDVNKWRTLLTTDSYDLPVPNVVVPSWMVVGPDGILGGGDDYVELMDMSPTNVAFADLLEYRIRQQLKWSRKGENAARQRQVMKLLRLLLPTDFANGLRLDINRPFGNGRDDNLNGVVDEPGEWDDDPNGTGGGDGDGVLDPNEHEGSYWAIDMNRAAGFVPVDTSRTDVFEQNNDGADILKLGRGSIRDDVDRDGDGVITPLERGDTDGDGQLDAAELVNLHNYRRQMLAKDLYVLAMLLVDPYALNTDEGKAKTRSLAQWAINVVDFRDADNCMTPFEYDENPFDGWGVDGDISNASDIQPQDREVVWGAERPELLITETLAWHDRRSEDHVDEDISKTHDEAASVEDSKDPDQDFDQLLAPRGAGFIELYNPWPANPAANADTQRVDLTTGEHLGVDLAAVDEMTGDSPVWRVAVYRNSRLDPLKGNTLFSVRPEQGVLLDPDAPEEKDQPNLLDRCIYFCGFDPESRSRLKGWDNDGVAFFEGDAGQDMIAMRSSMPADQRAGPVVRPGRYMVVGSGESNGGNEFEAPIGDLKKQYQAGGATQRMMVMRTNNANNPLEFVADPAAAYTTPDETPANLTDNARSVCDIAVMNRAGNGTAPGENRPFTFSEPVATSRSGKVTSNNYPALLPGVPIDTPFDDDRLDDPAGNMEQLGFVPGFRWCYLQRLANPLLPWNPEPLLPDGVTTNTRHDDTLAVNPYCTVDTSAVNLTIFNGRSGIQVRAGGTGPLGDELINGTMYKNDQSVSPGVPSAVDGFASIERGQKNDPIEASKTVPNNGQARGTSTAQLDNLWNPENPGYTRSGKPETAGKHIFPAAPTSTLGFLNNAFSGTSTDNVTPDQPFPWFAWNNRPFISSSELMQVPNARSSQLMRTFSMKSATDNEVYSGAIDPMNKLDGIETDGLYRHQPNFFRQEMGGSAKDEGIAGLYRVLEYLHVPSKFVGTQTWLNPAAFGRELAMIPAGTDLDPADPRHLLQPPFNRVSAFRDPGRVNLNTIVDESVYNGLMHGDGVGSVSPVPTNSQTHPAARWVDLVNSRRVFPVVNGNMLTLDPMLPTFFENPFRSADAADLVPLPEMVIGDAINNVAGVHCTMLRAPAVSGLTGLQPIFAASTMQDYNNANRNPSFRYQPMTRLDNLTTTRSNVFAVWITVGFFEVEEVSQTILDRLAGTTGATVQDARATFPLFDTVYPEGLMFGKEAGSETGEIERLREFAVVDRTIPVAFEPGENHNVDLAIPLRRRIE